MYFSSRRIRTYVHTCMHMCSKRYLVLSILKKGKREKSVNSEWRIPYTIPILHDAYRVSIEFERIWVAKPKQFMKSVTAYSRIRVLSRQYYEIYRHREKYIRASVHTCTCAHLCEFQTIKGAYRCTNELYIILTYERHYRPCESFANRERRERRVCRGERKYEDTYIA